MNFNIQECVKILLPSIVLPYLRALLITSGVRGRYDSFLEAKKYLKAKGLNDYSDVKLFEDIIDFIEKCRQEDNKPFALREFNSNHVYNYPMISALLLSMSRCREMKKRSADILDFGGSLGVSWFRNRNLLKEFCGRYCVVEQKCVVDLGKINVPEIEFFCTVDECLSQGVSRDICIFSSVLQYLDDPIAIIEKITEAGFDNIIVDRALFASDKVSPRIAIQYNNDGKGQYPINIMMRDKILSVILNKGYELIAEWPSFDVMPVKTGIKTFNLRSQGFLASRKQGN